MSVLGPRRFIATFAAAGGALALATTATAAGVVGASPAEVSYDAGPGDAIAITSTVTTPELPPTPDVVLLVDRTGSMGGAIDNVKANMAGVIATVRASQPDARFAVAQYCDFGDPEPAFDVLQDLTSDDAAVTAAVDSIGWCSGGDWPEAQLNALWEIGSAPSASAPTPHGSSRGSATPPATTPVAATPRRTPRQAWSRPEPGSWPSAWATTASTTPARPPGSPPPPAAACSPASRPTRWRTRSSRDSPTWTSRSPPSRPATPACRCSSSRRPKSSPVARRPPSSRPSTSTPRQPRARAPAGSASRSTVSQGGPTSCRPSTSTSTAM